MLPFRRFVWPLVFSASWIGCQEKPAAPKPAAPPPAEKPAAPKPAPRLADPACLAPFATGGDPRTVEAHGKTFARKGSVLTETTTDPNDEVVIGVIADVKEDTPENLQNLDAILGFFKAEGAELIVATGDLGESQASIEAVLDKLASAKLPLFGIIGNRDGKTAFGAAFTAAEQRHAGLFNLNQIRLAQLDDVALLGVPGYYNPSYLHQTDGCLYTADDLEAMKPALAHAQGRPVVIVSHGPPKMSGAEGLDRTLEQENVGDPALAKFIKDSGIKFGVFANIHEAGGRATDLAGAHLIAPGTTAPELFLNSGPADAVRWTMNDGTESVGMGAVLKVSKAGASWKGFRIPKKG